MKNFVKYPAILFTVFFIAALYVFIPITVYATYVGWGVCLLLACVFAVLMIKFKNTNISLVSKYVLTICAAVIFSLVIQLINLRIPISESEKHIGKTETVRGYVTETVYSLQSISAFNCVITECGGTKCNFNVYAVAECDTPPEEYKIFTGEFTFSSADSRNENEYAANYSYVASGITLIAQSDNITFSDQRQTGIVPFFNSINNSVCNYIVKILGNESGGLIGALLFGSKEYLPLNIKRDFNTLGITHLLVVSGMNIALLAGMADFILLHQLKAGKKVRSLITAAICLLYMALCGFSLSVIRASLMQVLCRLSPTSKSRYHSLTSLFISILVILTFSPGAIYDIGLCLSFLATLGIITFGKYTESFISSIPKIIKAPLAALIVSVSASVFVLPLSYFIFGEFSLISPLSTIIFAFFLDIILYLTPFVLILSFIPFLGGLIVYCMDLFCQVIIKLTSYSYIFKGGLISFGYKGAGILIALLIITVILAFIIKSRKPMLKVCLAFTVYIAICITGIINTGYEGVWCHNENSNDAILICDNKQTTVIDISTGSKNFVQAAANQLYTLSNTTYLDRFVLTHYHKRHITTIGYLANTTHVKTVMVPEAVTNEEAAILEEILSLGKAHGLDIIIYDKEFRISEYTVFSAPLSYIEGSAHPAISLKITGEKESAVYFSSGYFEKYLEYTDVMAKSEHIVFGSHGPLTKHPVVYEEFDENSQAYFAADTLTDKVEFDFSFKKCFSNGTALIPLD